MACIVDTSVALKWAVTEPGWEAAQMLLSEPVIAPDLLRAELAHALYKKVRTGGVSPTEALIAQAEVEALLSFIPAIDMAPRALELSLELGHAAGDCFFLALAESIGLQMVTADLKFVDCCRATRYSSLVRLL